MEVIQTTITDYVTLLGTLRQETANESTAVALLQEIAKDRRVKQMNGESVFVVPATEKQLKYLKKLGIDVAEGITKDEASQLIDKAVTKD